MARWIAGLDGCRSAWAGGAARSGRSGSLPRRLVRPRRGCARRRGSAADRRRRRADRPARPVLDKGRPADRAARRLLGPARASVFPVPHRARRLCAGLFGSKGSVACKLEPVLRALDPVLEHPALLRAIDTLLRARPDLRSRVHEVHPEVAFFRLNGDRPLEAGKKGPRRRAGLAARRALLEAAGLPEALVRSEPPRGVGRDDHLDAMAALVVARDILERRAVPLPDPIERDTHGPPIVIWAPAHPASAGPKSCEPCAVSC